MIEKLTNWLIKRHLKKRHIKVSSHDSTPTAEFRRVLNTLRENNVMVETREDGIYIRLAGSRNNGESFSKEWVRAFSFPRKKILYIDMDGVIADFEKGVYEIHPQLENHENFESWEARSKKIDQIVEENLTLFEDLPPMDGAIEAVKDLFNYYEVYFLSTPPWNVPESFGGKRIWLEKHFGELAKKRLILSHRKDLNTGDFLVDDRIKNGVENFKGYHIHFGTSQFPTWGETHEFLIQKARE